MEQEHLRPTWRGFRKIRPASYSEAKQRRERFAKAMIAPREVGELKRVKHRSRAYIDCLKSLNKKGFASKYATKTKKMAPGSKIKTDLGKMLG